MSQQFIHRPRRMLCALALGLALAVAGCGGSSTGAQATSTPVATPFPTPSTTWRLVLSADVTGAQATEIYGVSGVSASDVWAVGDYMPKVPKPEWGGMLQHAALIEHWNGSTWSVVANPDGGDSLHGVAAVSSSDVWAVGGEINFGVGYHPYRPLIEHWNGSAWAIIPTPETAAMTLHLNSVAAIASNDVWAVGQMFVYVNGAPYQTPLIEHWNGTKWSLVTGATLPAKTVASLDVITAIPGTNHLWAVGSIASQMSNDAQPLIELWSGAAWQVVTNLALPSGAKSLSLRDIVAVSATDAWAVGSVESVDGTLKAVVAHWDGALWKVAHSPDVAGGLSGVAAARAGDVRAVGGKGANHGDQTPLIEQWNGTAWQIATSLAPSGAPSSGLADVASDGAGTFWAVGAWFDDPAAVHAFIERCP